MRLKLKGSVQVLVLLLSVNLKSDFGWFLQGIAHSNITVVWTN